MRQHLSISQITFLVAAALVVGGLLVFLFYLIHKMFRQGREKEDFSPKSPRVEDDSSFAMAAMQGVIARMKEQEKELEELRRDAERRAHESARLSENVIREMPNGLIVFDRQGFLSTANPAVRRMLGVDVWSRRRFPEILGRESRLAALVQECLEKGAAAAQATIEEKTATGDLRLLGVSVAPLHSASGEIDGAVCLLTDITEVRRLQEQVRLKEHLAALGAMAAGLAHEFKNSLATISGYAQLLRDSALPEEDRPHAEKIVQEVRLLTQVVADFLSISKPLTLAAELVNVEEIVRGAMAGLSQIPEFAEVAFEVGGNFAPVEGDAVLLRQAFSNLLRNACEAVAAGPAKQVSVQGEVVRQGENDFLRVRVCDTGGGVSDEDRERIFLPFFTTKPTGSGLGLALVQKIIVTHNGTVSLESSSSDGSTFAVLLPTCRAAQA